MQTTADSQTLDIEVRWVRLSTVQLLFTFHELPSNANNNRQTQSKTYALLIGL